MTWLWWGIGVYALGVVVLASLSTYHNDEDPLVASIQGAFWPLIVVAVVVALPGKIVLVVNERRRERRTREGR